jgi:hypothetical protein
VNKALIAVLNDQERLLVAETERARLDALDEDAVLALHDRVRRVRNKYAGQYRRGASARVVEQGARGQARPKNQRAAMKAEAFEEALSAVSRRLAALARRSAAELRAERIAAAKGGTAARRSPARKTAARKTTARKTTARKTTARKTTARKTTAARSVTDKPRGDRSLRSPASAKRTASTRAAGARRQAKRDGR